MKKKLKLYQNFGKYDINKQIILNEPLELDIELSDIANSQVIVTMEKDNTRKKFVLQEHTVIVPQTMLTAGVFKMRFDVMLNGVQIKRYTCEDLMFYEDNEQIRAIPEIEILKDVINKEIEKNEMLTKKVDKLTQLVSGLYKINIKTGGK